MEIENQEGQSCFFSIGEGKGVLKFNFNDNLLNFFFDCYRINIGVFFCGFVVFLYQFYQIVNVYSNVVEGIKFYYNKENF